MLIIFSALAAIIPMSIYVVLIWKFDRYDKEPFKLVFTNYLWGALGAIVLALIGSIFFTMIASLFIRDSVQLSRFGAVVVAPIVEEITKGLFLLITITNKKFDNITDGFVYGGAIGLGFGMTENFLYFITYGDTLVNWITIVIIRTLFSAVMHCVATATFGAFLAYGKFKKPSLKIFFTLSGLFIAMFIHLAWNFSVSFEQTTLIGFLFMLFTIIIFISVFAVSILSERKIIYIELLGEVETGLIPLEHLHILNSAKRNRFGWVDESIRKLYINAATTLAFRKMQLKNAAGFSKVYYEQDVSYYRNFIQNLLSDSDSNK